MIEGDKLDKLDSLSSQIDLALLDEVHSARDNSIELYNYTILSTIQCQVSSTSL